MNSMNDSGVIPSSVAGSLAEIERSVQRFSELLQSWRGPEPLINR